MRVRFVNSAAVTANTTETLMLLSAAANQQIAVLDWILTFQGQNNLAAPIQVEVCRYAGLGGGDALTGVVLDTGRDETVQTSGRENLGGSDEPSISATLDRLYVHPQGGWEEIHPSSDYMIVPGGAAWGIRVVSPGTTVSALLRVTIAE